VSKFFEELHDRLLSLTGRTVLVGISTIGTYYLNVDPNRKFIAGCNESLLLQMLEDTGVSNKFVGLTRQRSLRQLDYILCNFVIKIDRLLGLKSDNYALCCSFSTKFNIFRVPTRFSCNLKNLSSDSVKQMVKSFVSLLLLDPDISNSELLLELDIFYYDLYVDFGTTVKFKSHDRVSGQSRQISKLMLCFSDKGSEYRAKLLKLQQKDAARRFGKFVNSNSLSSSLRTLISLSKKWY